MCIKAGAIGADEKKGIKSGPVVGKILRSLEEWWFDNKAKPSRDECLKKLNDFSGEKLSELKKEDLDTLIHKDNL